MNIFYIEESPDHAARSMVDKHIVKQIVESAQMLSTAHRLLDAKETLVNVNGKQKHIWLYDNEQVIPGTSIIENPNCYLVAHAKHPSTIWTMATADNYRWHVELFRSMINEYHARYNNQHKTEQLLPFLQNIPHNLSSGNFTPPTPAMPDEYKTSSVLESYRQYYAGEKWKFAKWKHNQIPEWFFDYMHKTWTKNIEPKAQALYHIIQNKQTMPMDSRVLLVGGHLCDFDKVA